MPGRAFLRDRPATLRFTGFASSLAKVVADVKPADVEALLAAEMNGETVEAELTELIHVIGENMKFARFAVRTVEAGALSSYIHMGGKIGVLCEFSFDKPETASADAFKTFAHDVAMQVAATAPVSARREDVPAEIVEREEGIYMAQAAESSKPGNSRKMAVGRLEVLQKGSVLNEQGVHQGFQHDRQVLLESVSKELGDTVKVIAFDLAWFAASPTAKIRRYYAF